MGFDIGNIMGLVGDAAELVGTGGMDPMAWMDAVDNVAGMAGGSSGGSSGGGSDMSSVLGQLGVSMIQNATDA